MCWTKEEDMLRVIYSGVVGSLMYVMECTRLEIARAVEFLSIYMSKLGK